MKRSEVIAVLEGRLADIRRFGVKRLALFGSMARDEARAESDIDFLVEFEGSGDYDRYIGLKMFLEDLLGENVDLVTARALRPRMRGAVERDAVRVA